MNKLITLLFATLIICNNAHTQEKVSQTQLTESLRSLAPSYSLEESDFSEFTITDLYTHKQTGITHIYLLQTANNYPIFNAQFQLHLSPQGTIMHHNSRFFNQKNSRISHESPEISVDDALSSTFASIESLSNIVLTSKAKEIGFGKFILEDISVLFNPLRITLGYESVGNELVLAYQLIVEPRTSTDMLNIKVDAVTGEVIHVINRTLSCQFEHSHNSSCNSTTQYPIEKMNKTNRGGSAGYNAYPIGIESPIHGSRELIFGAELPLASPYGWHDVNGAPGHEYTITRGNNVHAYEDIMDTDFPGYSPDGGAMLDFDFPLDFSLDPFDNMDAALTNLFVWNNFMHDLSYFYGFDEISGNFQQNNYGNGGLDYDWVEAQGFDGGGTNNANFGTPEDGYNPRMQMYLWYHTIGEVLTINSPPQIEGSYQTATATFGPPIPQIAITEDLILVASSDGAPSLGCSTLSNAAEINGKIAVADRGTCTFVQKATMAQDAGALALIIINNQGGGAMTMGGDDFGIITIPVISISLADGNTIKAEMEIGDVNGSVGGDATSSVFDSNFDNGIICHEYGHGISNRLTGGPSQVDCLWNDEQMGEGWSDFFSLITSDVLGSTENDTRGIGNFASARPADGPGIRPYPYTHNMSVNPLTYANISQLSIPHGVGSVWCTMLWDLYWNLSNMYGNSYEMYTFSGGNNIAIHLVMEGMRIQSCNPGFIDGRDAILVADQYLYDGAHECLIWETFARRGLGYSASQGSSFSVGDETQAFDMPPSCTDDLGINDNDKLNFNVYPNPASNLLTITNDQSVIIDNVRISDLAGKIISTISVNSTSVTVPLDDVSNGMYLLEISSNNQLSKVRFVKM